MKHPQKAEARVAGIALALSALFSPGVKNIGPQPIADKTFLSTSTALVTPTPTEGPHLPIISLPRFSIHDIPAPQLSHTKQELLADKNGPYVQYTAVESFGGGLGTIDAGQPVGQMHTFQINPSRRGEAPQYAGYLTLTPTAAVQYYINSSIDSGNWTVPIALDVTHAQITGITQTPDQNGITITYNTACTHPRVNPIVAKEFSEDINDDNKGTITVTNENNYPYFFAASAEINYAGLPAFIQNS